MLRSDDVRKLTTGIDLFVWQVDSSDDVWIAYSKDAYAQIAGNLVEAAGALKSNLKISREFLCRKPTQTGDFPVNFEGLSAAPSISFSAFEKSSGAKFNWFRSLFIRVRDEATGAAELKINGDAASLVVPRNYFLQEIEGRDNPKGLDVTFGAHNFHLAASWLGGDW